MAGTNNSWNNQIAGSYNQIILNAGTNGVAISTDASAATVNVATGGAVKTSTFGSTNSTSSTTVQSGSGALALTSTNGTWTGNSGTGALGLSTDASATTVSLATGAAVKTVTLGSTNTTSSTSIRSGTGNIAMNTGLTIDSTGRNTNAVQPAFLVYLSATTGNVTGDNTDATVPYDTKVFDQGNNFNTGTSTFTAPVTGKYQFNYACLGLGGSAGTSLYIISIRTTAQTYSNSYFQPATGFTTNGAAGISGSMFCDMTAGDTAFVSVLCAGAVKNVSFDGARQYTWFGGYLVC